MNASHWDDDDEFPPSDWRYEVENGDTRLGYKDWLEVKREQAKGDRDEDLDTQAQYARACADLDEFESRMITEGRGWRGLLGHLVPY